MKTKAYLYLAAAIALGACQAPGGERMRLKGTLTDLPGDTLLVLSQPLTAQDDAGDAHLWQDTLVTQRGKFALDLPSDTLPLQVILCGKTAKGGDFDYDTRISLLVLPGETLTVDGSLTYYTVAGSDFQTAYDAVSPYWKAEEDSLRRLLRIAETTDTDNLSSAELLQAASALLTWWTKLTDKYIEWIRLHPDEPLSVYLAYKCDRRLDEALPLLGDKAKNSAFAPLYRQLDRKLRQQQDAEKAAQGVSEGSPAPDFTLKDLQGRDISLSSLRGKYVVLDFWGSWCGWCVKGIPDMKACYAKYKDRMEILGIDCRDTREEWKAAVEQHALPWLHVYNEGTPDVARLYAVQGYPTKIVVDPEGTILKIVRGEDPAFYAYLDGLFK